MHKLIQDSTIQASKLEHAAMFLLIAIGVASWGIIGYKVIVTLTQ